MKNFILGLALIICGNTAIAQDHDPKAKTILDAVSKESKAYKSVKAEYTYIIKNKAGKETEKQTGKVEAKGTKFKLEIPGNIIICDSKTVWNFNKDAKEVTIKKFEPKEGELSDPSKIFTIYEKGFKYKYEKQEKIGATKVEVINLFPSENVDKKKFHTIKLYVDTAKKQIKRMRMMMKDGTVQEYTISSLTPNAPVAETVFTPDTKGYEVIDER